MKSQIEFVAIIAFGFIIMLVNGCASPPATPPKRKMTDNTCRKWFKYVYFKSYLSVGWRIIRIEFVCYNHLYSASAEFTGDSYCQRDVIAQRLACMIQTMSEENRIILKPDHYDKPGNDPYDGASALDNILDVCSGFQAKRSKYTITRYICTSYFINNQIL
jgi:hypothetical protein